LLREDLAVEHRIDVAARQDQAHVSIAGRHFVRQQRRQRGSATGLDDELQVSNAARIAAMTSVSVRPAPVTRVRLSGARRVSRPQIADRFVRLSCARGDLANDLLSS
jgi:hypothetical protein